MRTLILLRGQVSSFPTWPFSPEAPPDRSPAHPGHAHHCSVPRSHQPPVDVECVSPWRYRERRRGVGSAWSPADLPAGSALLFCFSCIHSLPLFIGIPLRLTHQYFLRAHPFSAPLPASHPPPLPPGLNFSSFPPSLPFSLPTFLPAFL